MHACVHNSVPKKVGHYDISANTSATVISIFCLLAITLGLIAWLNVMFFVNFEHCHKFLSDYCDRAKQ